MTAARNTVGCPECAWGKVAGCWRCGSRNAARATLGALAFAALIFGAIAITAGEPSDVEALADMAMAHDDAVIEARINAASLGDNERLAWRICKSLHAERAVVLQMRDSGEYVCRRSWGDL